MSASPWALAHCLVTISLAPTSSLIMSLLQTVQLMLKVAVLAQQRRALLGLVVSYVLGLIQDGDQRGSLFWSSCSCLNI